MKLKYIYQIYDWHGAPSSIGNEAWNNQQGGNKSGYFRWQNL